MNERIRELARKANFTDQDIEDLSPGFEKFARLIVQRCGSIYDCIDNGNDWLGTDNYLEALHKHFRSDK